MTEMVCGCALHRRRGFLRASAGAVAALGGLGLAFTADAVVLTKQMRDAMKPDDIVQAMKKVKDSGGKVLGEPMDIPNVGRMAIIQDPTGAMIAIFRMKN